MNTVVDPGIKFFWLFSTEFRGPVCLTNKNLNSIEKWIPSRALNLGEYMTFYLQLRHRFFL